VTITSRSSGGLTIGDGARIFSSGANTSISSTSPTGNISLGSSVGFHANGGNLIMLSLATIGQSTAADSNDTFIARAVGTSTSNRGGIIELGSGTLTSYLSTASGKPPGTKPPAGTLGPDVVINNGGTGVVQVNNTSGNPAAINLEPVLGNPSTLTLTHGAIIFDAIKPGSSVIINQGSLLTNAFQPISYVAPAAPETGREVPLEADNNGSLSDAVRARILAEPGARFKLTGSDCVQIRDGSLCLRAPSNLIVDLTCGKALLRKGALAQIEATAGRVSVRALSGIGDVRVVAGQRSIILACGQEITLTDHPPTVADLSPDDGIGRRGIRVHEISPSLHAVTSEFSIVTVIANTSRLTSLRRSIQPADRKLFQQLLRTAASVDMARRNRGAFRANAKPAAPSDDPSYTQADLPIPRRLQLKASAI